MAKDSFILYTNQTADVLANLSDEQSGILFRAIVSSQQGKDLPTMDALTQAMFNIVSNNILRMNEKYERIKAVRSLAGQKGMANRWGNKENNEDITNITKITNDNKNNYNDNDNDNVNDNDNDNVKNIRMSSHLCVHAHEEKNLKEHYDVIMQKNNIDGQVKTALWEFIRHCHANNKSLTNERLINVIDRLKTYDSDIVRVFALKQAVNSNKFEI